MVQDKIDVSSKIEYRQLNDYPEVLTSPPKFSIQKLYPDLILQPTQ